MKRLFLIILCHSLYLLLNAQEKADSTRQKSVTFSGGLSASTEFYHTTDTSSSRDPFSYMLAGDFNLSYKKFTMPFSVMYSNRNFSYSQPFNRIGFSPEYKWVKLHLGYRSVTYSSFTLAGHSFLGAGLELNPGKLRFGCIYGRFNKKTVPNTLNPLDTLGTNSRKGYSVKLGYGSEKNYFDLIFLKITDDTLSKSDTSRSKYQSAQGNMVIGTQYKFTLFKKFSWETEAALSVLTNDLNPLYALNDSNEYLQRINHFFPINISTQYSTAIRSSFQYNSRAFNLGVQYRRIDPNYQSFGAYYFNTDLENLTMNGSIRLLNKKLMLRGNAGIQQDNLKNNKNSGSRRFISMFGFDYNTGKVFAINGTYTNYSVNQFAGTLPLNDTIKLYQTNRSVTLSPRLSFVGNNMVQLVQFNATYMDLLDHNEFTAAGTKIKSSLLLLNYTRSYQTLGLSFYITLNQSNISTSVEDRSMTGVSFGGSKNFFQNKLSASLLWSENSIRIDNSTGSFKGHVSSQTLSAYYRPFKNHMIRCIINANKTKYPNESSNKSFNDTKIILSYAYTF